ncbi:MAG: AraC family transcriptional regulator [Steroidobacteraceae bacterium]
MHAHTAKQEAIETIERLPDDAPLDEMLWERNPKDEITLEGLARIACRSRYHFLRTFRNVAAVTPCQYVLRRRFLRACVGLRCSAASIASVAEGTGFSDLSSSNLQFRRIAERHQVPTDGEPRAPGSDFRNSRC